MTVTQLCCHPTEQLSEQDFQFFQKHYCTELWSDNGDIKEHAWDEIWDKMFKEIQKY